MARSLGSVDFCWDEFRHLGEFDGKVKYGRFLRPGEQPVDAVFREKKRKDEMRSELLGMTRWIWLDLMPQGQRAFLQRLRTDLERSASLFGPRQTIVACTGARSTPPRKLSPHLAN